MLAIDILIVLVATLLGCLGNIGLIVATRFSQYFYSLFIVNSAVLDILSVVIGCCVYLLGHFQGSSWFSQNPSVCQSLGFFSAFTALSSILGWLCLAFYSRQIHRFVPKNRQFRLLLIASWVLAIGLSSIGLGLGTYSYDNNLKNCSPTSTHYLYFITAVSFGAHTVALVLSCLSFKLQKRYHLQVQWQRHRHELQHNDPEQTTMQSSQSELSSSTTNSIENLLLAIARTNIQEIGRPLESVKSLKTLMFEDTSDQRAGIKQTTGKNAPLSIDQEEEHTETANEQVHKKSNKSYTIPLRDDRPRCKLHKFKGTISFAEIYAKADHDHRQFLKLVIVITFLSLIGWMPMYVISFFSLFSISLSASTLLAIYLLTYLKALFGPLFYFVCCEQYREIVTARLRLILKGAVKNHTLPSHRRKSVTVSENQECTDFQSVTLKTFAKV